MRRKILSGCGFFGNVVFGALLSVISIPLVIRTGGVDTWGSVAVGQSVGGLTAVIVMLGWSVSGPREVALSPHPGLLYRSSLVQRGIVVLPAFALGGTAIAFIHTHDVIAASLSYAAYAIPGMSATWFYIGLLDGRRLFLLDTAPRLVLSCLGIAAMATFQSVLAWLVMSVVGSAASCFFGWRGTVVNGKSDRVAINWRSEIRSIWSQCQDLGISGTAAVYSSGPVALVGAVAPGALAVFALGDRMLRYALLGMLPVSQLTQGWVPRAGRSEVPSRAWRALAFSLVIAILCVIVSGFALPALSGLLGSGFISVSVSQGWAIGVTVAAVVLSRCTGLAFLVALGRNRTVLISTLVGAVCGLLLVPVLAISFGSTGAAWAVAASELTVLAIQLGSLIRRQRSMQLKQNDSSLGKVLK